MKGWFISETITRKSTGDITLHQYEVNNMKIYTLSSLIDNHQLFCKFAQDAYSATDCLCQDYPKYFEWYWFKDLPRVFNGTGEIVVCTIDDNIAGIASLKKLTQKRKFVLFLLLKNTEVSMLPPRCWNIFLNILALANRLSQLRITKSCLLLQL